MYCISQDLLDISKPHSFLKPRNSRETMKQKVVLNVSLKSKKKLIFFVSAKLTSYSKAMEIAAGFHGVQSVELKSDRSNLEVTGEDIDLILLVQKLKEKIGNTRIVSVEEKKEEKDEKDEKKPEIVYYPMGLPQYYELPYSNYGGCTIFN